MKDNTIPAFAVTLSEDEQGKHIDITSDSNINFEQSRAIAQGVCRYLEQANPETDMTAGAILSGALNFVTHHLPKQFIMELYRIAESENRDRGKKEGAITGFPICIKKGAVLS